MTTSEQAPNQAIYLSQQPAHSVSQLQKLKLLALAVLKQERRAVLLLICATLPGL
jgi:hypothetical protein